MFFKIRLYLEILATTKTGKDYLTFNALPEAFVKAESAHCLKKESNKVMKAAPKDRIL